MFRAALAICLALPAIAPGSPVIPLIIDTDMGRDDVMAIALILAHREIPVEAITVVNGLAHVPAGAANARRLVHAAGRTGIMVLEGRENPLQRTQDFLPDWRKESDQPISKINIPAANTERGEIWLARRLKDTAHPVRILALGPLTNVAVALAAANRQAVDEIVMMGGAFHVPGNFGGSFPPAEGNFFVDPEAAARVFRSGVRIRVVPLDATNQVKMDPAFVTGFKRAARGSMAGLISNILDGAHEAIAEGSQYAWDALAAAAMIDPGIAVWTLAHVVIRLSGKDVGRSIIDQGMPNARVALSASRNRFDQVFAGAFAAR
jgi:pyrimidine-specific ribonucleoside hydrolase